MTATQLKLERMGEAVVGRNAPVEAVWKIKLWASRLGDAATTDIGEIWVSAKDAAVLKVDVHPGRLS